MQVKPGTCSRWWPGTQTPPWQQAAETPPELQHTAQAQAYSCTLNSEGPREEGLITIPSGGFLNLEHRMGTPGLLHD
ncbi:hypothetical protein ILYODFUR_034201 [Ilyodon furcidens]|uniref:Uncharacterized protein n=1 Tax=Ilyodon furcidens TaxID=33524 RepID=A0ABV0SRG3_9TELE